MMRTVEQYYRAAVALLCAVLLVLSLAPFGLAAEDVPVEAAPVEAAPAEAVPVDAAPAEAAPAETGDVLDKGTDAIEIAPDGTVTLVSGHIAAEAVASVQFVLNVPAGAGFTFDGGLGDRITKCYPGEGTLRIYVSGADPLMSGTRLVIGRLSTGGEGASLAEDSLKYVYGKKLIAQNAVTTAALPEDAWLALQQLIAQADGLAAEKDRYTEESWSALLTAWDKAAALDETASKEELESACSEMQTALAQLKYKALASLELAIAKAGETLAGDLTQYTPESVAALRAAYDNAVTAQGKEGATDAEWADAEKKLTDAMALVPVGTPSNPSYDPGGSNSGSDGGSGGVSGTTAPTATAAPTATPSATAAPTAQRAPNTGDETAMLPWMALLAISAAALTALCALRKRSGR